MNLKNVLNVYWWGSGGNSRGVIWTKYDPLCDSKDKRGLGSQNLHLFNIAMLGKVGCRLLTDPDALVSRVLKAKYSLRNNFLTASLDRNPNFTWRSIWESRDLVRRGT
ncbi:hypothetical protein ACS0TY_027025 [Phlomoides rotata]